VTTAWAKKHSLSILTLPGVSLDLSILETEAYLVKRKFHFRRCTTQKAAMARFKRVFTKVAVKSFARLVDGAYNSL
jgi:hypothetical protein